MPMNRPPLTYTDRMQAAFGYRPSHARACPRVVAGKRCLQFRQSRTWPYRPASRRGPEPWACACVTHHDLLAHRRIWLNPEGRHVFTVEPYGIERPDALAAFTADCAALGLTVTVSETDAQWCPGSTVLITVRREVFA